MATTRLTMRATARGGPRVGAGALLRYREPTKPPAIDGASARQAGELERLRARYGRLEYAANGDGTLRVVVYGDGEGATTVTGTMRADGALDVHSGSFRPRSSSTGSRDDDE